MPPSVEEILRKRRESYSPIKRWLTARAPKNHCYNWFYYSRHPHRFFKEIIDNYRTRKERGRRGWAVRDTWSLDLYLLSWLPDALDFLADNSHTWHQCEDASTPEEWKEFLHSIASGLRAGREWFDGTDFTKNPPDFDWAFSKLHQHFWHLWD